MAARFHLCLLLIILGTVAVQGARLGNRNRNPMPARFLRQIIVGSKYLLIEKICF